MFNIVLTIILLVLVVFIVKFLITLEIYVKTQQNHLKGQDVKEYIETATERVLRIVEEEFGKKHTVDEAKKMTFAEGMLNDVLREAGFDVTKFNIKGLLQAKKQEKGL